jgi:hypothetical protein
VSRPPLVRASGCACALLLLAACERILGIEDAHFDPAIGAAGLAGTMSSAPRGGSTSAAGGSASGSQQPETPADGGTATLEEGGRAGQGSAGTNAQASAGESAAGSGGDTAGEEPLCERYCSAIMAGCSQEHAQYIDRDGCLAACAKLAAGAPGDRTGNSIQCRLTYAMKANSEPYTYCTWAGPGGDGKCGSNCEGFCTLMMQACSAETTEPGDYFTSYQQCQATCQALPDVGEYSASNSSLQMGADHVECRLYHVGAALAEDDPLTHCHHAMGRTLCVDSTDGG